MSRHSGGLPPELIRCVLEDVHSPDSCGYAILAACLRVNSVFYRQARPLLYRDLHLCSWNSYNDWHIVSCYRRLARDPTVAAYVQHIVLPEMFGTFKDMEAFHRIAECAIGNMKNLRRVSLDSALPACRLSSYLAEIQDISLLGMWSKDMDGWLESRSRLRKLTLTSTYVNSMRTTQIALPSLEVLSLPLRDPEITTRTVSLYIGATTHSLELTDLEWLSCFEKDASLAPLTSAFKDKDVALRFLVLDGYLDAIYYVLKALAPCLSTITDLTLRFKHSDTKDHSPLIQGLRRLPRLERIYLIEECRDAKKSMANVLHEVFLRSFYYLRAAAPPLESISMVGEWELLRRADEHLHSTNQLQNRTWC